jgi:hypothetical protein
VEWSVLTPEQASPFLQASGDCCGSGRAREKASGVHIYGHISLALSCMKKTINFLLPTGGFAGFDEKHYYSHPHPPP